MLGMLEKWFHRETKLWAPSLKNRIDWQTETPEMARVRSLMFHAKLDCWWCFIAKVAGAFALGQELPSIADVLNSKQSWKWSSFCASMVAAYWVFQFSQWISSSARPFRLLGPTIWLNPLSSVQNPGWLMISLGIILINTNEYMWGSY